jgi:hypothetical protein
MGMFADVSVNYLPEQRFDLSHTSRLTGRCVSLSLYDICPLSSESWKRSMLFQTKLSIVYWSSVIWRASFELLGWWRTAAWDFIQSPLFGDKGPWGNPSMSVSRRRRRKKPLLGICRDKRMTETEETKKIRRAVEHSWIGDNGLLPAERGQFRWEFSPRTFVSPLLKVRICRHVKIVLFSC